MRKFVLVTLLLVLYGMTTSVNAQNEELVKLLAENNAYHKEDSLKVVYLRNVFRKHFSQRNTTKALVYADSALTIAKKLSNKEILYLLYHRIALGFHGLSDYPQALYYYDQALSIATPALRKELVANTMLNKGSIYMDMPDYIKSLESHQRAITLFNELGDSGGLSSCYMNIATTYYSLQQYRACYDYTQKALNLFLQFGEGGMRGKAVAHEMLGKVYMVAPDKDLLYMGINPFEKYDVTIDLMKAAIPIAQQQNDYSLKASLMSLIGDAYEGKGDDAGALNTYLFAIGENKKAADVLVLSETYVKLGGFYGRHQEINKGIEMLRQGIDIAKKIPALVVQQKALEGLSVLYEKNKKYDSSLMYYREYIVMRDSVYNQEKEKEVTRKRQALDFDIKEREYKLQQQLTDEKLKRQILLAQQQQQQLQLQQQQAQIVNKEKDLQRLTFLSKQAELENQKKEQAALLKQEQLESDLNTKINNQKIAAQQTEIRLGEKRSFIFGVAALIVLVLAIVIFYSRRKSIQLNRIVSEQKKSLEELVSVKDKIFSVVSHDMRNPVNALISFTHLLENGTIPQEKMVRYAAELKNSLSYTSTLMENLLNWAASQMQGFTPKPALVDIGLIASDVVDSLRAHISQKKVVVQNNIPKGKIVYADKEMLSLVLRNLISNAIKFSFTDGMIQLHYREEKTISLVAVQDAGTGICDDKLKEINSRGNMAIDSAYGTKNEKGTGLGLLLSKTFVDMMHGKIEARNNADKGSTFQISLPRGDS